MKLFDPLRKRYVTATPEEKVRQWFIWVLHNVVGVPEPLMMSEWGLELAQKHYRADIIVYDRNGAPLAVVECKAENVRIGSETAEQALRYNSVLGVRYIFLTNRKLTYIYRLKDGEFVPCTEIPAFEEMLCQ